MNTDEQKTRERFPTSPQELRDFSKRLAYIAERFADIAKQADLNAKRGKTWRAVAPATEPAPAKLHGFLDPSGCQVVLQVH